MTAIFAVTCDSTAEAEAGPCGKLKQWGLAVASCEIDELWYVNRCKGGDLGSVQFHERSVKAKEIESLEAALEAAKGLRPVFIEGPAKMRQDTVELHAYRHPKDAIYVFGGDRAAGLWQAFAKVAGADWVCLTMRRGVYGTMAGFAVAYDRHAKSNR